MQCKIDSYDFKGKKAIVRVDFNVPLNDKFEITDDTRIRAAMPTLKKVLAEGGSLIIMSHLGRPKGVTDKYSLKHIIARVSELLGVEVKFAADCQKAQAEVAALKPGEALLLENLRFYAEEEGKPRGLAEDATDEEKKAAKAAVKESQKAFVKTLADYADCYINDAFGTAHRAHGSTALIAKYFPNDKMFGYLMEGEIKAIDNVLKNAQHPFTAIIGGSKVSSKLAVLESMLERVDNLIIGGGMGYTFVKAQGGKIGNSLHEDELMPNALEIMKKAQEKGVKIYENGYMYYTYYISKSDFAGSSVAPYYCVERNKSYRLTVTDVTSFGDELPCDYSNYDPEDPIDRATPRIKVSVEVLPWTIVPEQTYEIQ